MRPLSRHATPRVTRRAETGPRRAVRVSAELAWDAVAAARAAGLRHVDDRGPGIRRVRCGKGFRYVHPDGRRVTEAAVLARIRALAIPPAWTDVWICPVDDGHIEATGRDARGRKQYRYHRRWRLVRDGTKFHRMAAFGEALPRLRSRVEADLRRPGLPREKVLATVVRLLETTLIRVGNAEYARRHDHYGLTTLRDDHVEVAGARVRFAFTGKAGVAHEVDVADRRLASVVARCRELPGQDLFQYVDDDGGRRAVGSADVNDYLREVTGEDFTSKDFRTWYGTLLAALALSAAPSPRSAREAQRAVADCVARVARRLRNTRAVCRRCYIHPAVFERFAEGVLADLRASPAGAMLASLDAERPVLTPPAAGELLPEEEAVLALLRDAARRAVPLVA